MKLYEPTTGIILLLAALGLTAGQGANDPDLGIHDCERVAITNDAGDTLYHVLVDPACGAATHVESDPDPVIVAEVEEPEEPEESEEPGDHTPDSDTPLDD